jgi:hypothetical protein
MIVRTPESSRQGVSKKLRRPGLSRSLQISTELKHYNSYDIKKTVNIDRALLDIKVAQSFRKFDIFRSLK